MAPSIAPPGGVAISPAELFQLQSYIRALFCLGAIWTKSRYCAGEAAHRESLLEAKLEQLQSLIDSSQESCEKTWQALIDEDRLLSRIEQLETQLALYKKVRLRH